MAPEHTHTLSPEQIASIPTLYVTLGSNKTAVARHLGVTRNTIDYHLGRLSGEEWDRIREKQLKAIIDGSTEIILACVSKVNDPDAVNLLSLKDASSVYKVFCDQVRNWGMGAKPKDKGGLSGELDDFLLEAQLRKQQKAIAEALKTGSLDPLLALVPNPEPAQG